VRRMVVLSPPLKIRRDQVWGIPGGNAAYRCQRDGARFTNRRRCRPMTNRPVRDRLEQALDRIADPKGEGARTCLTVYAERARAAADAADTRARGGMALGPLDGAIVSIKDLFDVAGEATRAGSMVLAAEAAPAARDPPAVRRLLAGGAVIVAKTNMSEFAFS